MKGLNIKEIDIKEVENLFPELELVKNKEWVNIACEIWKEAFETSNWNDLKDAQFNPITPGVSLIDHTRATTLGAYSLGNILSDIFGVVVDNDILIISCILHDVCKLIEYEPDESSGKARKSKLGELYQHGFLSGYYALNSGLPESIVSLLVCHTGESKKVPKSIEGIALMYADFAEADFHRFIEGVQLFLEAH